MKRPLDATPLVTFHIGRMEFALDAWDVVEMTHATEVTRVPGAPHAVAGVTTWRGKTIPVVEPRRLLKVGPEAPDDKRRLLVLRNPGLFAILVDGPGQVLRIGSVRAVSVGRDSGEERAIRGLVQSGGTILRVLEPSGLLGGSSQPGSGPVAGESS